MADEPYHKLCLLCGAVLQPNAQGPETAPWRCDQCHRSWWAAELSQGARVNFRREQMDFGHANLAGAKAVRRAVEIEREQALIRGVSVRKDQLPLVPKRSRDNLLSRFRVHPSFAAEMTTTED